MALLAQFIGEDEVAKMSGPEIERSCEILHAEMLKAALGNAQLKGDLQKKVHHFSNLILKAARTP